MRTLAPLLVLLTACASGELIGYPHGDGGTVQPPGDGGGGGVDLLQPTSCPVGTHLDGTLCVSDEITCAEEFPCPMGLTCVAGRCVATPGPCATNDDCPTGDVCVAGACVHSCAQNAMCQKDADCGTGALCVQCMCVDINQCTPPTADLSVTAGGKFAAHQVLHLDEALGDLGGALVGILKKLRDGILGCPSGSSNDCFLYQIIAGFLPQWAQTLVVAVANFGDIIDDHNFIVDSEMSFTKNGLPSGYDGIDHWLLLTFNYQNHIISKKPEDITQIGQPVIVPFTASTTCGVLYVDKHKVQGVLSGILRWIVDTVVEVTTCNNPQAGVCYHTLGDAIDGAIDCSQINDFAAQAACITFKNGLKNKINQAIDAWVLNYSLMTLKGTAKVPAGGKLLTDGHWDGTLGNGNNLFKNFTGEWSAKR